MVLFIGKVKVALEGASAKVLRWDKGAQSHRDERLVLQVFRKRIVRKGN